MFVFSRTLAPVVSGTVFSATLSPATRALGFPVNYSLIFVVFGGVWLLTIAMVTFLPESINRQKIIEDE